MAAKTLERLAGAAAAVAVVATALRSSRPVDADPVDTEQSELRAPASLKDRLIALKDSIKANNVPTIAAGVAFFAMLAVVPGLFALVSLYGLAFDAADVQRQLAEITDALPAGVETLITEQLGSITEAAPAGLGIGFAVGLAGVLWSASGGTQALIRGVNIVFGTTEERNAVKLRLVSLAITLGLLFLGGVVVAIAAVFPAVDALVDDLHAVFAYLRWLLLVPVIWLAMALLFRFAPARRPAGWAWLSWGAGVSTVTWVLATVAFSVYVSRFGSYNETYGTLGGVVVLLLFLYLSSFAVLLGASVDALIEKWQTDV